MATDEKHCHKEELKTVKTEVDEAFGKVNELLELISKQNYQNCVCGKNKPHDEEKLESLENENSNLKAQVEDLKYELTKRDQLKEEIARLKTELEKSPKKTDKNSAENLKNLEEQLKALREELLKTKAEVNQLRNENEKLQSDQKDYVTKTEKLTEENDEQEQEIEKLMKSISDLENERDKLKKKDQKWKQQFEQNDRDLDKLEAELEKLRIRLKDKDANIDDLQNQLKKQKSEVKSSEKDTGSSEVNESEANSQKVKDLESQLADKDKTIEKNKKQIEKYKSALEKQNKDLDKLEKDLDSKDSENGSLKSEIEKLTNRLSDKESEIEINAQKLTEHHAKFESLDNDKTSSEEPDQRKLEKSQTSKIEEPNSNEKVSETREQTKFTVVDNYVVSPNHYGLSSDCATLKLRIPDDYRIVEISKVPANESFRSHSGHSQPQETSSKRYIEREFCYAKFQSSYSMPTTLLCRCPKCTEHNQYMKKQQRKAENL